MTAPLSNGVKRPSPGSFCPVYHLDCVLSPGGDGGGRRTGRGGTTSDIVVHLLAECRVSVLERLRRLRAGRLVVLERLAGRLEL
jgi:hypothetical protein